MVVKLPLALLNLVLHELVDPQTHVNIVFEHKHDHAV